jgi:hypothetical protein
MQYLVLTMVGISALDIREARGANPPRLYIWLNRGKVSPAVKYCPGCVPRCRRGEAVESVFDTHIRPRKGRRD